MDIYRPHYMSSVIQYTKYIKLAMATRHGDLQTSLHAICNTIHKLQQAGCGDQAWRSADLIMPSVIQYTSYSKLAMATRHGYLQTSLHTICNTIHKLQQANMTTRHGDLQTSLHAICITIHKLQQVGHDDQVGGSADLITCHL